MFSRLLIANRGEIACRVIRTARHMGVLTIGVYSDADANAMHVAMADEAVRIGPASARESYLDSEAVLKAARETKAEAIHPGYGFLSENAEFAEACARAGIVFVGPPASAIRAMGLKDRAKALMEKAGVAVVPGYMGDDQTVKTLAREAKKIGYPVLIKAVAGGGGKGMRRVDRAEEFDSRLEGAKREAKSSFGDDRVLLEKYIAHPRHIEVQVFADTHGHVVHLFERDCSLQRRHQKVIEEAPAPGMSEEVRAKMGEAAVKAAKAAGYVGAGTVEFIADASEGLKADRFWFMEMNTRLQVEHPVTEFVTGLDLVEWQLRVAAGEELPQRKYTLAPHGHAVEARLYAEDVRKGFLPSIGTLDRLRIGGDGDGIRVDAGVREGDEVSVFYDPMIAKIIAWDATRAAAAAKLAEALAQTEIAGVETNAAFLVRALRHPEFIGGNIDAAFIDRHIDVLRGPNEPPAEVFARAALSIVEERRRRARGFDPWDAQDGFRLGGEGRERIEFVLPDRRVAVELVHRRSGRVSVNVAGELIAQAAHGSAIRLQSGAIAVMQNGETWTLRLHDPFVAAESRAAASDIVIAPMPGKIVQLFVHAGEHVKQGQPLAILEAMKMEHTLKASADAQVESIEASAGEQVAEGAVIVRFGGGQSAAA